MMERAVTILDPYADDAKAQELQDDTIEGEHISMSEIMKCLLIEAVEENPVVRIEDIDLALRDYRLLVATSTHFMMKNDEDMTEIERDGYSLWTCYIVCAREANLTWSSQPLPSSRLFQ